MKKTFVIAFLVTFSAKGQISFPSDPHLQNLKREAALCFEIRDLSCAKKKYSLVLKDNKNDAEALQKLKEIEKQKTENERQRTVRVERPERPGSYSGYGSIKGLYDSNWEKFDYQGIIKNGVPDGKGTADYQPYCATCGQEYGVWKNGKREGAFKAYYPSKSRYEASYKDNKLEGVFKFYSVTGERYEYFYKSGKKVGDQRMYNPNGSYIKVSTINDDLEGQVTYYDPSGLRLKGYYKDGDIITMTSMEHDNGFLLLCNITKNQTAPSAASITWPNKSVFKGNMISSNNRLSIKGTVYEPDGRQVEGEFDFSMAGYAIRTGHVKIREGDNLYEGEYNNGINGKGTFTFANGDYYSGQFKNGKFDGFGTYIMNPLYTFEEIKTCNYYEGNYVSGAKEGLGRCYNYFFDKRKNKQVKELVYEGMFKGDKPVGKVRSGKK